LKKKISKIEKEVENLVLQKKSEPTLMLEVQALKKDKDWLIKMLKST